MLEVQMQEALSRPGLRPHVIPAGKPTFMSWPQTGLRLRSCWTKAAAVGDQPDVWRRPGDACACELHDDHDHRSPVLELVRIIKIIKPSRSHHENDHHTLEPRSDSAPHHCSEACLPGALPAMPPKPSLHHSEFCTL